MNQENLRPFNELTEEEAFEIRSKGGKARAENIHRRKTLKEELLLLLETGDTQKNITTSLIQKALDGDVKAFEVIRDSIGEKQKEQITAEVENKVEINVNLSDE